MNNQRRKDIKAVITKLENFKAKFEVIADWIEDLSDLRNEIAEIQQDESDSFENMPESLQQSERGQQSEECIGYLEDAYSELDTFVESLQAIHDETFDAVTDPLNNASQD